MFEIYLKNGAKITITGDGAHDLYMAQLSSDGYDRAIEILNNIVSKYFNISNIKFSKSDISHTSSSQIEDVYSEMKKVKEELIDGLKKIDFPYMYAVVNAYVTDWDQRRENEYVVGICPYDNTCPFYFTPATEEEINRIVPIIKKGLELKKKYFKLVGAPTKIFIEGT